MSKESNKTQQEHKEQLRRDPEIVKAWLEQTYVSQDSNSDTYTGDKKPQLLIDPLVVNAYTKLEALLGRVNPNLNREERIQLIENNYISSLAISLLVENEKFGAQLPDQTDEVSS